MKKLNFLMVAVLLACFFLSCGPEGGTGGKLPEYAKTDYLLALGSHAGLEEDTEWQIIQAGLKKLNAGRGIHNDVLTINDVWVAQFYGAYCPVYLVPDLAEEQFDFLRTEGKDAKNLTVYAVRVGIKSKDDGTGPRDVIINTAGGRAVVRYYDNSSIFLWNKGHLYDIEKDLDNFNNRILIRWDLLKIINRHNGLDCETDTMIREAIGKRILTGWPAGDYDFIHMKYLGAYNGYAALTLYSGAHAPAAREQIIGGVLFFHPYYEQRVFAWKEGEIYELESLYEQGFITHEDLVEMAYFHENRAYLSAQEEN